MTNEHEPQDATREHIAPSALNAGLGWISINDRLPPFNQYVACIDVNTNENTGGAFDTCVHQCAYLSNSFGDGVHRYWSVIGSRGMCLDAFTHWYPLLPPPNEKVQATGGYLSARSLATTGCASFTTERGK